MRKQTESFTLDAASRAALRALARLEADGNRSAALRSVIQDAARRRGVWPEEAAAAREVAHEAHKR